MKPVSQEQMMQMVSEARPLMNTEDTFLDLTLPASIIWRPSNINNTVREHHTSRLADTMVAVPF